MFCDGRTHGHTHNPILSGIRCFLRRRNATTTTQRELTNKNNNSIEHGYVDIFVYRVYSSLYRLRSLPRYVCVYSTHNSQFRVSRFPDYGILCRG